jgi:hypothetical protein
MKHVPAGPCIDGATRDNPLILERPRDEFIIFRCQRSSQPFVFLVVGTVLDALLLIYLFPKLFPLLAEGHLYAWAT